MSKKKKNKRNNKPVSNQNHKQVRQSSGEIRLSQCMIVKNEEKNIKRALEWAKPIVYEQIVVDTGSTDKTVEIAEDHGAKVLHFKWIDDFSAAKNFAIEQATGNWIAFLDADEYMSSEDAIKLISKIKEISQQRNSSKYITILRTPMVDIDDEGNATSVFLHSRIYRNIKELRYIGKIHESLTLHGESIIVDDISIIHTGYTETEHKEKNKTERNIRLLRKDLESKPDDILIKAYLADSLKSKIILDKKPSKNEEEEVLELFNEVIDKQNQVPDFLVKKAYLYLIGKIWKDEKKLIQCEKLCRAGNERLNNDLDLGYYYSIVLNESKRYQEAWDVLKKLEKKLTTSEGHITGATARMQSDPKLIFGQMMMAAQGRGDIKNSIKYATVLLTSDKNQQGILGPYIITLLKNETSEDEILGLLAQIYDIKSPTDLLFIARASKNYGAIGFARKIMTIAGELMG